MRGAAAAEAARTAARAADDGERARGAAEAAARMGRAAAVARSSRRRRSREGACGGRRRQPRRWRWGGGGASPPHSLAELAEFARRERERFEDVAAAHRQRLARPALLLQGASPFAKTPRPTPSPAGSLQERLRAVQQKFGSASDARVSSIGARR